MDIKPEKQKVISKNGWQVKLYRWAWDKDPEFRGYCPLFWACWAILAFSPLILLAKVFEAAWQVAVNLWPESAPKPEKEWVDTYSPDDYTLLKASKETPAQSSGGFLYYWSVERPTAFGDWVNRNPDWKEKFLPAAIKRIEEQKERNRVLEEKEKARRERLNAQKEKIIGILQWFVKPALAASAIFAAWLTYTLIGMLISVWNWETFFGVVKILVCLTLIAAAIYGLVKLGAKIMQNWHPKLPEIPGIPDAVTKPFGKVGSFFSETVEFISDTVKIVYLKKCPLVKWTDGETRPIEKNID